MVMNRCIGGLELDSLYICTKDGYEAFSYQLFNTGMKIMTIKELYEFLGEFIKKGLLSAVGHMADYQVILNAAGWHEKGVLAESDLAELNAADPALFGALPAEEFYY